MAVPLVDQTLVSELRQRVGASVPQWRPDALVRQVRPLTGGTSSLTFLVDLAGVAAAETPVVLKVAPPGLAPVRNRDVLLVDDILDTGKTLYRVLAKMRALKPRRIQTCVLLNKCSRRVEDVQADYVGFEIPDAFVVGYGLDFAERYRNLPFVGVLHPHVYKQACKQVVETRSQVTRKRRRA